MMNTKTTIDLLFPLSDGRKQVTIRRPKVHDTLAVSKMQGTDEDREIALFANLTELAPEQIEEMDMADYVQLQEAYSGFLKSKPGSSGKPA